MTCVLVPVPVTVVPPGETVIVHCPAAGKLFSITLPVASEQVGCVIVPGTGEAGIAFTVRVKVAIAAAHGAPKGLSVVTVIKTVFPASATPGV